MPSSTYPVSEFRILEGTGIVVMSRVTDWQNVKVLRAAVTKMTYYVYDLNTSDGQPTLVANGTADVTTSASNWFDTYQTAGWSVDSTGYNVACPIPAALFTNPLSRVKGGKRRVEIRGTPGSGDVFWVANCIINLEDALSVGSA